MRLFLLTATFIDLCLVSSTCDAEACGTSLVAMTSLEASQELETIAGLASTQLLQVLHSEHKLETTARLTETQLLQASGRQHQQPEPRLLCTILIWTLEEKKLVELNRNHGFWTCDHFLLVSDRWDLAVEGADFRLLDYNVTTEEIQHIPANGKVFLHFWKLIEKTADYGAYDYVVKLDADSVFLTHRLRNYLLGRCRDGTCNSAYFLNAPGELMWGPIELLHRDALAIYFGSMDFCLQHGVTDPIDVTAEDTFMRQCLGKTHANKLVGYSEDPMGYSLLRDYIGMPLGVGETICSDHRFIVYHPFKDPASFKECRDNTVTAESEFNDASSQLNDEWPSWDEAPVR